MQRDALWRGLLLFSYLHRTAVHSSYAAHIIHKCYTHRETNNKTLRKRLGVLRNPPMEHRWEISWILDDLTLRLGKRTTFHQTTLHLSSSAILNVLFLESRCLLTCGRLLANKMASDLSFCDWLRVFMWQWLGFILLERMETEGDTATAVGCPSETVSL